MPKKIEWDPAVVAEICRRYKQGETPRQLGGRYGVCAGSVNKLLDEQGVGRRGAGEALRKISPTLHIEIVHRYMAKESVHRLARSYGVSTKAICTALDDCGVKRRGLNEARGVPSALRADVCNRYEAGQNTAQLAKAFGVSDVTIGNLLNKCGVKRRSLGEAMGGVPPENHAEICRRYGQKESTVELAAAYGVTARCIGLLLEKYGVKRRSQIEANGGVPVELYPEVCEQYEKGKSTCQVAESYGVSNVTVCNVLKRCGVEARQGGGFGDNVQDVIDGTGHHARGRECELYLFSLARYGQTHCKAGIAFDTDARVRAGQGEYGEEHMRLFFNSRREALFLEQAVLDATRGNADCPGDLTDWAGAGEIRAIPADEMVPIIERLADELDELGAWEFAARYVPMTAAQRVICQQRAQGEGAAHTLAS